MADDIRLYKTRFPMKDTNVEQDAVLIERGDQRYGFVSCMCYFNLYSHTAEDVTDDLKRTMEDMQVSPVEIRGEAESELVGRIIEEAERIGVGVSGEITEGLNALLGSI